MEVNSASCVGSDWHRKVAAAEQLPEAMVTSSSAALPSTATPSSKSTASWMEVANDAANDGSTSPTGGFRSASPSSLVAARPCRLTVDAHTLAGRKLLMPDWVNQDTHMAVPLGPCKIFVGVFDGHGEHGHLIAGAVRDLFIRASPTLPEAELELPDALSRLFALARDHVERTTLASWSGTTATVALVDCAAGKATVAHVGDSRILVVDNGKVLFETEDHIVDAEAERHIVASGGEVREKTISGVTARRVFIRGAEIPGLSMSRAIGDLNACAIGVISEPTISVGVAFPPGSILIAATDGVWEKMHSDAAGLIASRADALRRSR